MFKIGFNVSDGDDVFLVCTQAIRELSTDIKYRRFVGKGNDIHSQLRKIFDGVYFGGGINVQKDKRNYGHWLP